MVVAGIDFSTRAVDVVLLDEDTDAATWHRFELTGPDAFERTRDVRRSFRSEDGTGWFPLWEDVLAVGIEDPRGFRAGTLYRVQGAILASIPSGLLVHPLIPSHWRKTVGLPGNASKDAVYAFTNAKRTAPAVNSSFDYWSQDACDAYCIALATRSLIHRSEEAASA